MYELERSLARLIGTVLVAATTALLAQSPQPRALYEEARARDAALRKSLDVNTTDEALLARLRTLVTTYEDIARLFPSSPYSDDALWQGARLSGRRLLAIRRYTRPRRRVAASSRRCRRGSRPARS
jgi:hypothetical protein